MKRNVKSFATTVLAATSASFLVSSSAVNASPSNTEFTAVRYCRALGYSTYEPIYAGSAEFVDGDYWICVPWNTMSKKPPYPVLVCDWRRCDLVGWQY